LVILPAGGRKILRNPATLPPGKDDHYNGTFQSSQEPSSIHALSYHLCYRSLVAQREKRSVSLPPELARAVEEAARAEGTTFSAWLAETAAHRLKLEAGRKALTEWERENGPLTEAELAEGRARARASLGRAPADHAERKSA
jgi:hypothetical protein